MSLTYRMTAAQSDDWTLGNAAQAAVAQEIRYDLQGDAPHADVTVLLDDGSIAFGVWAETPAITTDAA